jgi:ATP-dependent RNA helicase SUPV3L1/SUV3
VALLGPTNTGKTHRATERMLEHESGVLGLPLRLLAREVYDRVSARVGETAVALVTGEEKRVPRTARYWICTVEAMPVDLEVDFLAVDEIQLVAHPERGHVFTDRLLRARGRIETWFLGADTARPLVAELAPTAKVRAHPRLSSLRWAGAASLATLPPRSAVVAFGMSKVYELAERVRAKRGGAAVVLGALSPRARNAQVAMYQAGEVQYLVATDAIGMGLNLDLDHVAFAELTKFDGQERRPLDPAELAQIAGRAGRFVRDGTFGVLEPQRPLPEPVARAIEEHRFAPLRKAYWRNAELDLASVEALLASLREPPRRGILARVPRADDTAALEALARDREIVAAAQGPERVALLWDVCRIPDYRQLLAELHHVQLKEIFLQLLRPPGRLRGDWLRAQLERLEDTGGDIEDLLAQMAQVRTWTYVTSHPGWAEDAETWQATARAIEDRLSDALHDRLVQRFVDRGRAARRGGVSRPRPSPRRQAEAARREHAHPSERDRLAPEGPFARLLAMRQALADRAAVAAGGAAPAREVDVEALVAAEHAELEVDAQGTVWWSGRAVGRLAPGRELLLPEARPILPPGASAGAALRVERRLTAFARDVVADVVGPVREAARRARSAPARGVLWQLERSLGSMRRARAEEQIALLSPDELAGLAAAGVTLGDLVLLAPSALRARALVRRFALLGAWLGERAPPSWPAPSATSVRAGRLDEASWEAAGYLVLGPRAVRADVAERACAAARAGDAPIAPIVGCKAREEPAVRRALALGGSGGG